MKSKKQQTGSQPQQRAGHGSLEGMSIFEAIDSGDESNLTRVIAARPQSLSDRYLGMTPLHWAAGDGNWKMMEILLEAGKIDLSIRDDFGRTAMDMALAVGSRPTQDLLARQLYPKSFQDDDSPDPNPDRPTRGPNVVRFRPR